MFYLILKDIGTINIAQLQKQKKITMALLFVQYLCIPATIQKALKWCIYINDLKNLIQTIENDQFTSGFKIIKSIELVKIV